VQIYGLSDHQTPVDLHPNYKKHFKRAPRWTQEYAWVEELVTVYGVSVVQETHKLALISLRYKYATINLKAITHYGPK
jgi:hypothetical protein